MKGVCVCEEKECERVLFYLKRWLTEGFLRVGKCIIIKGCISKLFAV